jgi:hypothetical protein
MRRVLSKLAFKYGSETRVLSSQGKKRIGTSQMRFLQSVLGVTLRGKMRSGDIQERLETDSI